jgi:methanogen extracellular protein (TIGR04279 family)
MKMVDIKLILIFALLIPVASSTSNLAVIRIDNENVNFINHTSDPSNGNWIVLSGGTSINIPEIDFVYTGVSSKNYTKNGKNISIISPANYQVRYPFNIHQMYTDPSPVKAVFNGSTDLAGQKVDIYLTKTSPTELRNIARSIIDGNTRPFRNLLNSSIYRSLDLSLDPNGDKNIDFGNLSAGDYVTIVMLNESNPGNLTVLSSTTFQVLEYTSKMTAPARVQQGEDVEVNFDIEKGKKSSQDETYTYGAFMIHEESYKEILNLKSNGTKAGTNLNVNSEFLIDGFKIAGTGLNKVNKSTVQKIAEGAIGANNGSVLLKTTANKPVSFSLTTEDLKPGRYILNVGVWSNKRGERLVGFGQEIIIITPPCSISTINGYNFNDINRNRIFDPEEVGLANWTIKLIGFDTCSGTMVDIATTTNATGYFEFGEVTKGTYVLIENIEKEWIPTTDLVRIITIPSTPTIIEENFGNWKKN